MRQAAQGAAHARPRAELAVADGPLADRVPNQRPFSLADRWPRNTSPDRPCVRFEGATQGMGETRLATESIVSPLVKATLPVGLYKTVDSSLRKSLPVGLYKAIRLLGKEIMLHRLHRAGVKRAKAYAEKRGLKLNIGCGPNRKEGWLNIDLSPGAEFSLDMRERIPLPDGSATIIYSEHFLIFLDYPDDVNHFLRECYRVLESGGIFRVGVPDTRWPLLEYAGLGDGQWLHNCKTGEYYRPEWCKTPLDHLNYHFRAETEHRYAYDFDTMEYALEEAGFVEINQCGFDTALDAKNREVGTLYVNARKPSAVL